MGLRAFIVGVLFALSTPSIGQPFIQAISPIGVVDGYTMTIKHGGVDLVVKVKDIVEIPPPHLTNCLVFNQRYYVAKRCVIDRVAVSNSIQFFDPEFIPGRPGVVYSKILIDGEDLATLLKQRGLAFETTTQRNELCPQK